ncbi:MAG: peroxiredoxin [Chitinispirillaceae bacterium]|nr:peroxiredoxin [Chitinispirillaceae bacterium]
MKIIRHRMFPVFAAILFVSFTLFAREDSMLLKTGTQAPDFSLLSSNGDTVALKDFIGKHHVVLIFYPGDQTPGCTAQLCAIRDDYAAFEAKNAKVFGVNPADLKSHKKFAEKQNYQFPLLVDENRVAARAYGCDTWPMVKRTVYVIDTKGTIIFAKRGMPKNEEILQAIK